MVFKLIHATEAKPGTAISFEGDSYIVKSNDISKSGRHGHSKCRIEAEHIIDGKKKVFNIAGHNKFEVPLITKNNGQILSIAGNRASIMDLKSFETLEILVPEELKEELNEGDQVEYWDVEGIKLIKKKI